jgi:hypothetical protein
LIRLVIWIINLRVPPARFPVKSLKQSHFASRPGSVFLAAFLAASLASAGLRAAIFDFSAQYQGVSAFAGSGNVSMSVFDEERLGTVTLNVPSGTTFDLSVVNGVVVWSSGNIVYYYTYDAIAGSWKGESVNPAPPASNLQTTNGIVAWSTTGGTIYYRVFDRARGQWRNGIAATGPTSNLGTVDGTVAWSTSGSAHARVYDPAKGTWEARDVSGITPSNLINTNGVVLFSRNSPAPATVYYNVYDPTRNGWQFGSSPSGMTFDLRSYNGVVAWSVSPAVYYAVYDPSRGQWMTGSKLDSGYTADLTISDSVVVWSTASASYARGYDPGPGTWSAGPAVRLARFAASANYANAPLLVHFIDMSIGGVAWNWSFGDGAMSSKRSPIHRYTNLGAFTATETVTGSFGATSASSNIVTDITAPAGTVLINGGAEFTTNPAVTLRLSATDNSGTVVAMRLSNDGANWNTWEPYATNRSWTMAGGSGTRTVYAQFADAGTNVSAVVSDSILLDTSSLPIVFAPAVSVAEGLGEATVRVLLSTNLNRLVSVNYATANGTANAGTDFVNASGRLDFPAGSTQQTFTVSITQDPLVELNETIQILLSNPTNCILGPSGGITILDDDPAGVFFSSTNFTVLENASNGVVTLQLTAASGKNVSIGVLATNGTASMDDFTVTNAVVVIPSGEASASFLVPITNDNLDELSETIALRIIAVTNASVAAPGTATLTILDDDPPRIGFSRRTYTVFEDEGFLFLNVWLSKPVTLDVGFDYLVLGGTASPGASGDYFPDTGRRTIAAGSTNVTLLVNLVDNALAESDETIHVSLSNITGATPGPNAESDIVIYDDDGAPRLMSPRWGADGRFHATARGRPGVVFAVEASSDFAAWTTLFSRTNTTGATEFSDPGSIIEPQRFYRTRVP